MSTVKAPQKDNSGPYWALISSEGDGLDSLNDERIRELYVKYGAVLFRGFDLDVEAFGEFVKRFTTHSTLNESRGRATLCEVNRVQAVDPGLKAFPLHPELSR